MEFLRKRLVFIGELLSDDGALYLHLDTRKAHYIKVLLDEIFGEHNFRAEIIWQRTSAHPSAGNYGRIHETILFFSKSSLYKWNVQHQPYDSYYLDQFYTHYDEDGQRWRRSDLTAPGIRRGDTGKPWRGINPSEKGQHWGFRVLSLTGSTPIDASTGQRRQTVCRSSSVTPMSSPE